MLHRQYIYIVPTYVWHTKMHAAFPLLFYCVFRRCHPRTWDEAPATTAPPIGSRLSFPRSISLLRNSCMPPSYVGHGARDDYATDWIRDKLSPLYIPVSPVARPA